jgi:hypothetical protein
MEIKEKTKLFSLYEIACNRDLSYLATARLNTVLAITEHITHMINPKQCLQRTSTEY